MLLHSAITCSDPGTPTNGRHNLSSTSYNSVVTYTCDVGYTLQESNSRTCQSSGQWSGSVPQCNCELLSAELKYMLAIGLEFLNCISTYTHAHLCIYVCIYGI